MLLEKSVRDLEALQRDVLILVRAAVRVRDAAIPARFSNDTAAIVPDEAIRELRDALRKLELSVR